MSEARKDNLLINPDAPEPLNMILIDPTITINDEPQETQGAKVLFYTILTAAVVLFLMYMLVDRPSAYYAPQDLWYTQREIFGTAHRPNY